MNNQEINEQVARKMGWTGIGWNGHESICGNPPFDKETNPLGAFVLRQLPDYTHSIYAAWEIVEHQKYAFSLARDAQYPLWDAWFAGGDHVQADTAPLAICLAFLKLP